MSNDNSKQQKAVIYLRVARTKRESKAAIEVQRHACERRAAQLGLAVVDEYVDHGSAHAFEGRPGLQTMLSDLKAYGDIRYVVAYDHTRIARNTHVYTQVVWAIEEAGARLEMAYQSQAQQNFVELVQASIAEIASRQHDPSDRRKPTTTSNPADDRRCTDGNA